MPATKPTTDTRPAVSPKLTPAEVAALYRVGTANVLHWISSGALPAVNTSRGTQRPRWRISREALEQFERRRAAKPRPKAARRRRRPERDGAGAVIEYW